MAIKFKNLLPEWKNTGTTPSEDLKNKGFQPGYKPPAAVFNWFWSLVQKCISELQSNLAEISDRGIVYDEETWTASLSGGGTGESGDGGDYVLPVATKKRLGGVIVGDGIEAAGDGRLSINKDYIIEIFNEDFEDIFNAQMQEIPAEEVAEMFNSDSEEIFEKEVIKISNSSENGEKTEEEDS